MIEPYDAYRIYTAIKLHFSTESYDYFKYNGKINVKPDAFEGKKEKPFFWRLAKKFESEDKYEKFVVSNMIQDPKLWVNHLVSEDAMLTFRRYTKIIESLSYTFQEELGRIFDVGPKTLLSPKNGEIPLIFEYEPSFSPETVLILNEICGLFEGWDKKVQEDIFWPRIKMRYGKYKPFMMKYIDEDIGRFKKIYKKVLTDRKE